jgi:hypothetical protein
MSHAKTSLPLLTLTAILFALPACTKHEIEVKPIEIKPIYITLDIRIQQAVDQSLKFVEEARGTQPPVATAPANP